MLTARKYEKHIRTLKDQIVFDYYALIQTSELKDIYDFTEFNGLMQRVYDQDDYFTSIYDGANSLKECSEQKKKILLKHTRDLWQYIEANSKYVQ